MLFDRDPRRPAPNTLPALAGTTIGHGALLVIVVVLARLEPAPAGSGANDAATRRDAAIVWVATGGPAGGGGGGGGNRTAAPPRPARAVGRDPVTLPVAPPVEVSATPTPSDMPPLLAITAEAQQAGTSLMAGAVASHPASIESRGSGNGDTAGSTMGPGDGSGDGAGIGPGRTREWGDGYATGNGVSSPKLLRDVKPRYTAEAMRARIAGTVGLSCVVDLDGSVRDCRLTRSLDARHGLDLEALRAAQRWQFAPGRRGDEPVPVRVTIEMAFGLR